MNYDPNWLQKERAKNFARQERSLSHIWKETPGQYPTALCGKGTGSFDAPAGIVSCAYPSLTNLPTCRQCREAFLKSIGVTEINQATGYPVSI